MMHILSFDYFKFLNMILCKDVKQQIARDLPRSRLCLNGTETTLHAIENVLSPVQIKFVHMFLTQATMAPVVECLQKSHPMCHILTGTGHLKFDVSVIGSSSVELEISKCLEVFHSDDWRCRAACTVHVSSDESIVVIVIDYN